MSLGAVVDVVIGLMFCYLLLGLIGSSLQEALAGWLNWRGTYLRKGLEKLLDHNALGDQKADWLFQKVFRHGLIAPVTADRAPSYISAANFSIALIDSLLDGSKAPVFLQVESSVAKLPDGAVKTSLTALLVRAGGDIDAFKNSVEFWFDDVMDRVSGGYKRFSNNFMLIFGVLIAFGGNLDTVAIANTLWVDPGTRMQIVGMAQSRVAPSSISDQGAAGSIGDNLVQLKALPLPMGGNSWTDMTLSKFIGCLVTALAVSLGGPFWFDTLQKFLNLRTTGPKPEKSSQDDE